MEPVLDFRAVFDALPTPYLVLDSELTIVAANRARETATGRTAAEVVGRHLFDAFPDDPDDPDAGGTSLLSRSLERVLQSGETDVMPVQRYNIPAADGGFEQRWWTPVNSPVLDDAGRVRFIVHRVYDVTDYMADIGTRDELETARTEVYVQGHALRDALTAEKTTAQRLASLVDVARELSGTATAAHLTEVVTGRGLAAVDADGGAVAVLTADGEHLDVMFADPGDGVGPRSAVLELSGRSPAAVAASSGDPVLLPDLTGLGRDAAEALGDPAIAACVAYPLRVEDRVLGALTIGWHRPRTFTDRDLGMIAALTSLCAQTLDRIQVRVQEQHVMAVERALSEALQRSLLSEPPQPPGTEIAVRYRPSADHAEVGGDWYDAFLLSAERLTVAVGDVAGHDRRAAAAMAQLRSILRGVSVSLHGSPADTLAGLDRALSALSVDAVATAVVAELDLRQDADGGYAMRWSSAGHLPPLVLSSDGEARLLRAPPNLLMGVRPDTPRDDHETVLPPGSSIVFYTDGLIERRDRHLLDGFAWLTDTLQGCRGLSAEELCDLLLEATDGEQEDDLAILVLRLDPATDPATSPDRSATDPEEQVSRAGRAATRARG